MVQLTNGTISYGRVKKDDDYGINRKAEASLTFNLQDTDGNFAPQDVEEQVFNIVHRLLAKQFTAAKAVELKAEPASVDAKAVPPPAAEVPAGSAPPRTSGDAILASPINDKEKLAAELFGQNARPPRAPRKPKEAPAAETSAPAAAVVEDDDPLGLGIVVPEAPAEPVTDAELGSATVAQNKKIHKPDAIRALIAEFAGPPPKQARDIPQEKRHAYLEKLKTLV